jgi:hypothetical protein
MDIAKYRKRSEAEVAKASRQGRQARAAARKPTGKRRPSAAARAKEIATAPLEADDLERVVPDLLATLGDRKESLTVRNAALERLAALDFLGPRFAPFRADYKQALRDVATDPVPELRELALEPLAIERDPYAQELIVNGLKRPEDALLPEAKAIQLLGYDDHAEIVPLVRRVYRRSKGPAREEALRVLATDPKSEPLLRRLLTDKSEQRNIRQLSASGLQSLNPEAFDRAARKIVADEDDYNDIRATAVAALAHGREARQKPVDRKLVDTVQKVADTTSSPALRSASRRFLQSTEQ